MRYTVIMSDGLEIIGKVKNEGADTITIESPVLFLDLFQLNEDIAAVWYSKNNTIQFNRNAVTYEYDPTEDIVNIYNAYINSEGYKRIRESVSEMLKVQLKRVEGQINLSSQDTISNVVDALQKMLHNQRKLH